MDKKEKKGEGKVSVIVTVKNDPAGERKLMEALAGQTVRPDEVIIVEGENRETPWHTPRSHPIFARRIVSVGCSRGKGRNIGVREARNEVVAVTDAGCRPRRDWIEKLIAGACKGLALRTQGQALLVVAGGYRAEAKTELQRIMAHFLVPAIEKEEKDQKDEKEKGNIPASRSIMFTKKAWETVGGYPEEAVSGGEDLEFARRLARHPEVEMIYCPEAVVDWDGPATLGEFFRDIVKHTRGNVEVRYWPHLIKNFTVVLRWMVFLMFLWMIPIYLAVSWLYKGQAFGYKGLAFSIWFPVVQLAADGGVIWGLGRGIVHKFIRWLK